MFSKEAAMKSKYNANVGDLFCKFCQKRCKNLNSLNNHQIRCSSNPDKLTTGLNSGLDKFHQDVKNGNRTVWNKGLTKQSDERIALQAKKNSRQRISIELELDDDGKLYSRYMQKKQNDKFHERRGFELTFEEYCKLVKEAGLVSSQLGFKGQGYVLARYNDEGPYKYGNCRFITQAENIKERKTSEKMRECGRITGKQSSTRMKALWQDPVFRSQQVEKMKSGQRKR